MSDDRDLRWPLDDLPLAHQIAFAASCCERMLPNYEAFAVMENWVDSALLRHALDSVWQYLADPSRVGALTEELVQACETSAPDTEDFSSLFTGAALDAVSAVVYTLEACVGRSTTTLDLVGQLSLQSLANYLERVTDPELGYHGVDRGFDAWVEQAPLLRAERQAQRDTLARLNSQSDLTPDFLASLRQSFSRGGIQPLLRGLIKAEPGHGSTSASVP